MREDYKKLGGPECPRREFYETHYGEIPYCKCPITLFARFCQHIGDYVPTIGIVRCQFEVSSDQKSQTLNRP